MKSNTSPRGANATRSRDHNRQLALGHLHASGALGRAERARRPDLTGAPVWQRRLPLDAATLDAVGAARDRLLESVLSRLSAKRALAAANIEAQDIETLQKMFGTSNPDLMGWLDPTLAPLSQAVALIENMFDPQTIVLCGVMPEPMVQYLIDHVDLPTRTVSRRADRAHPALRLGRCGR